MRVRGAGRKRAGKIEATPSAVNRGGTTRAGDDARVVGADVDTR
jgi:hypothetical protein